MEESNLSLEKSLLSTLADSDLQSVAKDAGEIFIDSFLTDGVLRDIPIVNTVTALAKAGINIKERLFVEKVLRFLQPLGKYTPEQRRSYLKSLNPAELKKASQYIILYLDRLDAIDKPAMLSKVFEAYMLQRIDYRSMLYFSHFIDSVFILVWKDYYAVIKSWYDRTEDPYNLKAISPDDALALEKVGFYREEHEAERARKTPDESATVTALKRKLVVTEAGWEFIRTVFHLWPEEDLPSTARSRLTVHLKDTPFKIPFGTF